MATAAAAAAATVEAALTDWRPDAAADGRLTAVGVPSATMMDGRQHMTGGACGGAQWRGRGALGAGERGVGKMEGSELGKMDKAKCESEEDGQVTTESIDPCVSGAQQIPPSSCSDGYGGVKCLQRYDRLIGGTGIRKLAPALRRCTTGESCRGVSNGIDHTRASSLSPDTASGEAVRGCDR